MRIILPRIYSGEDACCQASRKLSIALSVAITVAGPLSGRLLIVFICIDAILKACHVLQINGLEAQQEG